jgi:integrase/recombinase XerD
MLSRDIPVTPTRKITNASNTAALVSRWLHGKSPQSQRAYETDIRHFVAFVRGLPISQVQLNDIDIRTVTLDDVQDFADRLEHSRYSTSTCSRRLSAIKSLLSFGSKCGYLPVNVGTALSTPKLENRLAERILTELQVMSMIALEPNDRNRLLIRFLYISGCRVSEASNLRWRHLKPNGECGQAALHGKGSKTRFVILPKDLYQQLLALRSDAGEDDPVFVSRKHCALQSDRISKIVRAAGERIGIKRVSPHWLRHAHASHSLDRGAPIQLVQNTLGHASVATTSKYLHARPSDSSSLYLPG